MGTWDERSFGNDPANDWLYDLERAAHALYFIERTLRRVLEAGNDNIDMGTGQKAIAAAEAVAWCCGLAPELDAFTTTSFQQWIDAQKDLVRRELVDLAIAAVRRIQRGPSDLRDEGWTEWIACTDELVSRLAKAVRI